MSVHRAAEDLCLAEEAGRWGGPMQGRGPRAGVLDAAGRGVS